MTHVKESCGTAMVLCPFKEAGCKYRVKFSFTPLTVMEFTGSDLLLLFVARDEFIAEIISVRHKKRFISYV